MNTRSNKNRDIIWFNARIATMESGGAPFGLIENGAVAVSDGRIDWVGATKDLPGELFDSCSDKVDCHGRLVTPGLIDCHTHLVYGGNRAREFEMRLNGASYEEIARAGGGIVSTVSATRAASEDELFDQALPRVEGLLSEGVTTLEIKSGYGLNVEDELKMLRVARRLDQHIPGNIVTSFLGAHALPPEYADRSDAYIDMVCKEMLPAAISEGLVDAVDAFCETIAFSVSQVERVFAVAAEHDLPVKLHAEQLSDLKGAVMAAKHKALSVDHLEYLDPEDVPVLAKNNTVAVLLPGAFYCLRETKLPPMKALGENNIPIALASDSNPGSSPVGSLLLMLNMACTLFRMTPEEALAGITRNGARALGLENRVGTLETGKNADMVLWNVTDPAELSYRIGGNPCKRIMIQGKTARL
jgi:imidazolonepropionase